MKVCEVRSVSDDVIDQDIGARLRKLRIERHKTLSDVSGHLGVSHQQLVKYETGTNRISASTLYRLSRILDVQPAYFFADSCEARATQFDVLGSSLDSAFEEVLGRISDEEVRHAMRGLLLSLGQRGSNKGG